MTMGEGFIGQTMWIDLNSYVAKCDPNCVGLGSFYWSHCECCVLLQAYATQTTLVMVDNICNVSFRNPNTSSPKSFGQGFMDQINWNIESRKKNEKNIKGNNWVLFYFFLDLRDPSPRQAYRSH